MYIKYVITIMLASNFATKHITVIWCSMMKKSPVYIIVLGLLIFASTYIHNTLQDKTPILEVVQPSVTSPTPIPPSPQPAVLGQTDYEEATISAVVDGDTVKLSNGKTLRYIGVDTPETVDPRRAVGCFGTEASTYNRLLTIGKTVYLEKDVSDTDRYGRLLRYVYLQSGEMVNEMLIREGYAHASAYPPDVKYQDTFEKLETEAREKNAGLWKSCAISPTQTAPQTNQFTCDCAKSCNDITTCAEATFQLKSCSCKALDGNNDGIACNSLCR
jgi:micrococcal nuclease